MTLPIEQSSIKFQGSAIDNENFPIPYSFRHKEVLKVETINSAGIATQKVLSTDGINNDYTLIQKTTDMAGVTNDDVRTDHGWIAWVGVSPSDIVHIYKEESLKQEIDYAHVSGEPSIPSEDFELSKTRAIESFSRTLSRDDADPTAYGAKGNRITSADPVEPNDVITLGVLNLMSTSTTLSIPTSGAAGSIPERTLLVPTGFAPSTPAVAWQDRLSLPAVGSGEDDYLLSATATPTVSPYVEWSESRWIGVPPNNGLVWRVSYDRDSPSVTTRSMDWREYRKTSTAWNLIDMHGFYMITSDPSTNTSEWQQRHGSLGQYGDDPTSTKRPNTLRSRMIEAEVGTIGLSPRFNFHSAAATLNCGSPGYPPNQVPNGLGDAESKKHRVQFEWTMPIEVKDDSDNRVKPSMIFLCVKTFPVTVEPLHGGGSDYTAYPVFQIIHNPLKWDDSDGDLHDDEELTGGLCCMNRTQRFDEYDPLNNPDNAKELVWIAPDSGDPPWDSGDFIDKTAIIYCITVFDADI